MRSVIARFRLFEKAYPCHSSLIVFGMAIKGQRFSRRLVAFYFSELVDRGDYPKGEKKDFIRFYYNMNMAEDIHELPQISPHSVKTANHALVHV